MKLWLLGVGAPTFATAVQEASSRWPIAPAGLVFCENFDQAPWDAFAAEDLLVLLSHTPAPQQASWREHMLSARLPFQVLFGEDIPHTLQNLSYAWSSHVRHRSALRPEIPPRWAGVCEACSDPECEHRLFSRWVATGERQ